MHSKPSVQSAVALLASGGVVVAFASCGGRSDLGDAAEGDLRVPSCGDGVVDADEECDDAQSADQSPCVPTCKLARCGDGKVLAGVESCDDGGASDFCTPTCAPVTCGNGVVDVREACDPAEPTGILCTSKCQASTCGDGIVDAGEECDEGPANEAGAAAYIVQGTNVRRLYPVQSTEVAVDFYDYRSASAHTGFEAADQSNILLYVDTARLELSLITLNGIDRDASGVSQARSRVTQVFRYLPQGAYLVLADDKPEEIDFVGPNAVQASFKFKDNSDGGIIGLPWPGDYAIEIETTLERGVTSWGFVGSGDAGREPLDADLPALLVVRTRASSCRTDCTIPRCNDGILDAGETCDDGNADAGDACAPDCRGN